MYMKQDTKIKVNIIRLSCFHFRNEFNIKTSMLSFSLVSLKIFIKITTKSLLSVIDYESSKKHTDNVLLIKTKTIRYGGSLGSLFDEERSKVRESNANCRTP